MYIYIWYFFRFNSTETPNSVEGEAPTEGFSPFIKNYERSCPVVTLGSGTRFHFDSLVPFPYYSKNEDLSFLSKTTIVNSTPSTLFPVVLLPLKPFTQTTSSYTFGSPFTPVVWSLIYAAGIWIDGTTLHSCCWIETLERATSATLLLSFALVPNPFLHSFKWSALFCSIPSLDLYFRSRP